jgi:prepilin-type N-terminal cleavage/methylation domain-containing protein
VEKIPMNVQRKEKGFTIIEVVLVLAIAGLIFLMVFIALPALQRNQRDTQRKQDMSRLITALTSYTSSNRASLPTVWGTFESNYLTVNNDTFIDPAGASSAQGTAAMYVLTVGPTVATQNTATYKTSQNVIFYTINATCGTASDTTAKSGTRSVAFQLALEGGGIDCVSN